MASLPAPTAPVQRGGHAALARAIAAFILIGLLASGCVLRGSGYRYVRNSSTKTYFKVPDKWGVREVDTRADAAQSDGATAPSSRWLVMFDANQQGDRRSVFDPGSSVPTGLAHVQQLTSEERETISLSSLTNLLVPLDERVSDGSAQIVSASDVDLEGFRGRRLVYTVDGDEGRFTIDQTAVLDDDTRTLYVFIVGCAASCYAKNKTVINQVVNSWTVKER